MNDWPRKKLFTREIETELVDESVEVDCILGANHCSMHDAHLVHGSYAGNSTRRVGFQMGYVPSLVRATDNLGHEVYLARVGHRADNNYGDPTKGNERCLRKHPEQRTLAEAVA